MHRCMEVGDLFVCNLGSGFHRYVIVGKDVSLPHMLLLVMATSKIQKRKQYIQKTPLTTLDSLVEVQSEEYQSTVHPERCTLTKQTCFDCNNPYSIDMQSVQDYTRCDSVSDALLGRLKNAVFLSPAVDRDTKEVYGITS